MRHSNPEPHDTAEGQKPHQTASTKRYMHLASGGVCVRDKQPRCKYSGLERLFLACPRRSQAETGQHAGRATYSPS